MVKVQKRKVENEIIPQRTFLCRKPSTKRSSTKVRTDSGENGTRENLATMSITNDYKLAPCFRHY